eukprot:33916_1
MTLLSTFDKSPAKVHFNVECSANAYYTSLHPTTMDVKWRKSVHIELPSDNINIKTHSGLQMLCCKRNIDTTTDDDPLSIEIDIMIHDTDQMENLSEIQLVNPMNMMIMADMTASEQSYEIANVLSIFYGISNSIISILDSISDIIFIAFLVTQDDKTATFLLVLMIGNLISVAAGIAFYLTSQTVNQNIIKFWDIKQWVLCFLFFILSPCLPAVEWLLQKLGSKADVIMVSPSFDPMLLWFRQELTRNRIFIGEAIFESSFQLVIQFIAIFVLESFASTHLYLILSILISWLVIASKFILMSYNLNRKIILFNLLCYSMDILFSLTFALFLGALLFEKIFTFIGMWILLEIIVLVPFSIYIIASTLSSWLYFPLLLIFTYPSTTCVLCGFSIFPVLSNVNSHPEKIGRQQKFHRAVFEYCCNSKDQHEFDLKMIIINYVCIKSYFARLKRADNPNYYQLAENIYNCYPRKQAHLQRINSCIQSMIENAVYFSNDGDDNWYSDVMSMTVYIKHKQFVIRCLLLFVCGFMDIFVMKTFRSNSNFMRNYGEIIAGLGILCIVVLALWGFRMYCSYNSKWNKFCGYMIASKHESFILTESVQNFIRHCDNILTKLDPSCMIDLTAKSQIWTRTHVQLKNVYFELSQSHLLIILLQVIIVLVLIVLEYLKKPWIMCSKTNQVTITYDIITNFISIIICISLLLCGIGSTRQFWIGLCKAFLFSFFVSPTMVYFYMVNFYDNGCSNYQTLIVGSQFIGGLICFSRWNFIVSIAFFISYIISLFAQIEEWYYVIVGTFGVLIVFSFLFGCIYGCTSMIKSCCQKTDANSKYIGYRMKKKYL